MINFGLIGGAFGSTLLTLFLTNGARSQNKVLKVPYGSQMQAQNQPRETSGTPISLFGCYKAEVDSNHVEALISEAQQSSNKVGYISLLNFMYNQPAQAGGSEAIFIAQQRAAYFSPEDVNKLESFCNSQGGKAHLRIENLYFHLPRRALPNEAYLIPSGLYCGFGLATKV